MLFGFSVLMLFGAAGVGLDAVRAQRVSTRAAGALDSAALAAARAMSESESLSDAEIIDIARKVFAANTQSFSAQGVSSSTPVVTLNRADGTVSISSNLGVSTTLGHVVGTHNISFQKAATVSFVLRKVELAMVLDVTGSMNTGGKLDAMKDAATDVIDTIIDPNNPSLTRIALVPYSAAVNISGYQDMASGGDSLDGCVMERLLSPDRDTDEPPGNPRNFAVNGQLNSPSTGRYVCPAATLLPLTNDKTLLTNTVNGYAASGWTAGHIGLAWGWNAVSPKWSSVFSGANAPGAYNTPNVIKTVLLMTDGDFNTSYTSGTSEPEQTAESTARTLAMCNAMKSGTHNIQIYAVAFQAPTAAETLLRSCASSA
ncbi:MAG: hypothetical protein ABL897_10755, partial [Hyphomicrobium sp.]